VAAAVQRHAIKQFLRLLDQKGLGLRTGQTQSLTVATKKLQKLYSVFQGELQGIQNFRGPIPISTCSRREEVNFVLFANILSIILSDPRKTPDPARNTPRTSAKVRSFHTCAIASSISSLEAKSRSLRICFNMPKSQKSHGHISNEQGRCAILEVWPFLILDVIFDPLWHVELPMCTQKVDPVL
jgi:hypothetical protein